MANCGVVLCLPNSFRAPPGLPPPPQGLVALYPVLLGADTNPSKIFSAQHQNSSDTQSLCGSKQSTADTSSGVAASLSQDRADGGQTSLGYEPGRILHTEAARDPEMNCCALSLAKAVTMPELPPPPPLASVGSAGHHLGLCKPCDFASRFGNGCRAGTACKFCHLCGPENLRKSKRMRRAVCRAAY
jgi:hypothetical protein